MDEYASQEERPWSKIALPSGLQTVTFGDALNLNFEKAGLQAQYWVQRWGWTSTCSVLSAIVASQAATEKPVWAPRPSASIGAAGATVTPRSPLPGTASSREVLGPLARHRR